MTLIMVGVALSLGLWVWGGMGRTMTRIMIGVLVALSLGLWVWGGMWGWWQRSLVRDAHGSVATEQVFQFMNFSALVVEGPCKFRVREHRGVGLSGPYLRLDLEYPDGRRITVTDRSSGNGELEINGRTQRCKTLVERLRLGKDGGVAVEAGAGHPGIPHPLMEIRKEAS